MDLIQQDAVTKPTGIELHVINKSDDNNSDNDDDDDIGGPSNLNTNTGNNNAYISFLFVIYVIVGSIFIIK